MDHFELGFAWPGEPIRSRGFVCVTAVARERFKAGEKGNTVLPHTYLKVFCGKETGRLKTSESVRDRWDMLARGRRVRSDT
jgi:hypothetical protein